jgi:hypothetical protein
MRVLAVKVLEKLRKLLQRLGFCAITRSTT